MQTYITQQGDTWDAIAFKFFGEEKYMKEIIEANWPLLDTLIFPYGIKINIPEIEEAGDDDAPFWRSDDAEDAKTFSPTEEVGDNE